jgi:cobalamin biosynthesis protein CobD/CbiB
MQLDNPPVNNPEDFDIFVGGGPVWGWELNLVQKTYYKTVTFNLGKTTVGICLNGIVYLLLLFIFLLFLFFFFDYIISFFVIIIFIIFILFFFTFSAQKNGFEKALQQISELIKGEPAGSIFVTEQEVCIYE